MKKETVIQILAFIIPALIAFLSFKYSDTFFRIASCIPYGLVYCLVVSSILRGTSEEYRTNATTSEKVGLLVSIVLLPISFYYMIHVYKSAGKFMGEERAGSVWASFIIAVLICVALVYAIKFVIKLFNKE